MSGLQLGSILPGVLSGMAFAAEAKVAKAAGPKRTGAHVRRNSYHAGTREHTIWRPIGDGSKRGARRFIGAYLRAAEKYDFDNKEPGRVNGPLGHIAIQVLRVMFRNADYKTGRIDPAIDTLMQWTRRSRGAVVNALRRLKEHGFLDWIRRTEPLENPDPFGPQVRQISNAYGIDIGRLPEKIRGLLGRLLSKAPVPDDHGAHEAERKVQLRQWMNGLPLAELNDSIIDAHGGDAKLAETLARLGMALDNSNANLSGSHNPETEVK